MAGRVMVLYEPWDVTVMPEAQMVRVSACYPAALAALREAAAGHPVSEVVDSEDIDYTHVLYFHTTDPGVVAWIEQYLVYLAAQPDPAAPPAPEEQPALPAAEVAPAPAVKTEKKQRKIMPQTVGSAYALASARPEPRRQKLSLSLVVLALIACLVMGGAYWRELTAEPVPAETKRVQPAGAGDEDVAAADAPEDAFADAVDPSDLRDAADPAAPGPEPALPVAAAPEPPRPPAGPALAAGDNKLSLWAVDVGQGDGLVLRLPGGGFAVIDANRDGAPAMIALLAAQGCRELLGMVLTHPHADHLGDLSEIASRFPVSRFYESGALSTSSGYRYLLRTLLSLHVPATTVQAGNQLPWDSRVQISVLNANPEAENPNNASVVLRVQYGSTVMLLMGDAEREVEAQLLAKYRGQLRADVLKVGHHGSHSSSSAEFLDAVRPRYALVSVGAGNSFNHPHPDTMRALAQRGAQVFRTDQQGTIAATSDGSRVTVAGSR